MTPGKRCLKERPDAKDVLDVTLLSGHDEIVSTIAFFANSESYLASASLCRSPIYHVYLPTGLHCAAPQLVDSIKMVGFSM